MAKRFTDTEKWKKKWIRCLSSELKLFWVYIIDACNHAGILDFDLPLFSFMLGVDFTKEQIKQAFGDRVLFYKNDDKIFIRDFVDFQYGKLNEKNKVHLSVINILKKEGLYKGLDSPLQGSKDMDMDKDKEKDKDKDKETGKIQVFDSVYMTQMEYEKLVMDFGQEMVEERVKDMDSYFHQIGLDTAGKKYKSHYYTFLNWLRRENKTTKKTGWDAI